MISIIYCVIVGINNNSISKMENISTGSTIRAMFLIIDDNNININFYGKEKPTPDGNISSSQRHVLNSNLFNKLN